MIKTIFYISLLGLGNQYSLSPCDNTCFSEPLENSNSGLENLLGLAIRPKKLEIPQNNFGINLDKKFNDKVIGKSSLGFSSNSFLRQYSNRTCNTNLTNFGAVRSARYTPSKAISKFDNRLSSKKGFQKDRRINANGKI